MSEKGEYYNDSSTSIAGIPTPPDQQDITPTDMISGVVEEIMDEIQQTFEDRS